MKRFYIVFLIVFISSCATYYQRNIQFNNYFEQGELDRAELALTKDKKAETRKTRLLYFLNRGVLAFMQQQYAESNAFFEQAYVYTEDYKANRVHQALSFVSNPNIIDYKAEDHEAIYINYYKALNYFQLGDLEASLVECKRLNIRLQQQDDKYNNEKRFKKDAFIHLLMGIIYESRKDYNDAFIAYRNAYEIYVSDYSRLFNVAVPDQLKHDLIRTAAIIGFTEEQQQYEKEFGMRYAPNKSKNDGEVVFLWHNGLGPLKSEWSINFNIIKGSGGNMVFANEEIGASFPFYVSDDDYNSNGLNDLRFLRVAFPKYVERPLVYHGGTLSSNGISKPLSLTEDLNQIAIKGLEDRMTQEMGKSLLRLAIKKGAENLARNENEGLGSLVGIVNAFTEKADTRHWQTIPHSVYYTRMRLPEGNQNLSLKIGGNNAQQKTIPVQVYSKRTSIKVFHSLEFIPSTYTSGY